MIRKVGEEHHHTENEIEGYLVSAFRMVEIHEVPDDLRVAAFSKAVDLLAAKQIWHEQVAPTMAIPHQRLHG